MDAELWLAGWAYWTMMQSACVLIAGVEWWCARVDARAALRRSPVGLVDASWSLARAQGRLQVMCLVWACWLMTSGLAWFCTVRV